MPRFTISADSMDELREACEELFGYDAASAETATATDQPQRPKRIRRTKAQLAEAAAAAAAAAAAPQPEPSPALAPVAALTFPPAPEPADPATSPPVVTTAPAPIPVPVPVPNGLHPPQPSAWQQAAITQIATMVESFGEQPVGLWVRQQLSMSPTATNEELQARILQSDDASMRGIYTALGGKV